MNVIQSFLGVGAVILAFAYAFARKYSKDEYTRTFLFIAFLLLIVMFLVSLVQK